jgi:predicted transcriptional regulator
MKVATRKVVNTRREYDNLIKIVRQYPGIHFCELLGASGLAYGTLERQLVLLEKLGILRAHRSGGYTRYYNSNIPKGDMQILSYLKQRPYREIILLLLDSASDTFTFRKIVHRLGKAPSTVSAQLRKLIERKVVSFDERWGYTVNNKRIIKRVISKYRV